MDNLIDLLSELDINKQDIDIDELSKTFDNLDIYEDRIELSSPTQRLIIFRTKPCGLEINKTYIPNWIQ